MRVAPARAGGAGATSESRVGDDDRAGHVEVVDAQSSRREGGRRAAPASSMAVGSLGGQLAGDPALPRALGPTGDEALAGRRRGTAVFGSTRVAEATGPSDETQNRATARCARERAPRWRTAPGPSTRSGWRRPDRAGDRAAHRVADRDERGRCRARRPGRRRRRRSPPAGTAVATGCPRPWPRWSRATTSEVLGQGARSEGNQLRSAVAVQPWSSSSVGAPGGPATWRTNVRAPAGQLDRRRRRAAGRRPVVAVGASLDGGRDSRRRPGRSGAVQLTLERRSTLRVPLGRLVLDHVARRVRRAGRRRAASPGEITSRSSWRSSMWPMR